MDCLVLNGEKYNRLIKLSVGRYEYLLLIKDNSLYYVIEDDGTYSLPNPDLTLKGNVDVPLSNLNSRIIMEHIKNVIENDIRNGLIVDGKSLLDVLSKVQKILNTNEMCSLLKGGINELYHFDEEIQKLKDLFDELHNDITGLVPRKIISKENKKYRRKIKLDETANVDAVMIGMIINIGVLLFLILMLNILK